ncbi:MAG: hybrid sensor histidine kinase/response regulator [Calditrichaeota bacterium]|nr:MAG: response regulator [Calditrichota bacterium]MBL1206265.1 hybrid sensor histidine kinase/response regulator [Calditrichota bacterium]NOG46091.1 response regulator [Calditrichota bacterium]
MSLNNLFPNIQRIVFRVLLFLICFNPIYANSGKIRFEHLTVQDGLSNSTVYSILQDHEGFLWFGTPNGLNKYDGLRFTIFKNIIDDTTSLSLNNAGNIYIDKQGIIWVGQWGGGLDAFDPKTNKAKHFVMDLSQKNSISDNRVQTLFEDSNSNLWLGTFSGGLNKIDKDRKKITIFKNDVNDKTSLSNNRVWSIAEDKYGYIWVATSHGLNRLNPKTGKFEHYFHAHEDDNSINNNATRVLLTKDSTLWIGTIEGFNRLNLKTMKIKRYLYKKPTGYRYNNNSINSILYNTENKLWFCTANGVIVFDPKTEQSYRILRIEKNPESLSDNEIRSAFQDRSGIIWLGTKNNGISKYNPANKKFNDFSFDENMTFSLKGKEVQSMSGIKFNNQNMLLFSNILGFFNYNISKRKLNHFPTKLIDSKDHRTLYFKNITPSIKENNVAWIGAQQKFYKYNASNNSFTVFRIPKRGKNGIRFSAVSSFFEDGKNIWLGNDNSGLSEFSLEKKEIIRQFIHSANDTNSISHNEIYFLLGDDSLGIWIGTGNGLDYFDKKTSTFRHIKFKKSLNHDRRFFSVYVDTKGIFWLGTEDGLIEFYPENGKYKLYNIKDGLPDNKISSILKDKNNMLWLGTENGLSRFDTKSKIFVNFDHSDGLKNTEYTPRAIFEDDRGYMYFGGKQGLDFFNPKNIQISNYRPPIAFTDFRVLNESITPNQNTILEKNINNTQHIKIPYSNYVFSFEFAALDFTKPKNIEYAYKLEGIDKDWLYTNAARNFATYTNISGGEYVFKVKATNSDGIWKSKIKTVKLTIIPPFWDTLWFKTLAFFILVLSLFSLFRLRVRSIKNHNKSLSEINDNLNIQIEQRIKAEKEKEQMQAQLLQTQKMEAVGVLAGGIAHDFNNLLTAILGNLELSQMYIGAKNEAYKLLGSAQKAVMRAKDLTHQLLTFSKGGEPVRETASLEEVVRESASFVLSGTNIKSYFNSSEDLWNADIDKGQISQVVQNLVLNAKEAIIDGGTISLNMSNVPKGSVENLPKNTDYVLLTIIDSGEGIGDEVLKSIFNPYFTTKKKGNGLGLAVSYSVIVKHNGHINVESTLGKGTTFHIYLPAANAKIEEKQTPFEYQDHGRGKILVMDDEESIRNILNAMLTKLGYEVECAKNGDEAIAFFKQALDEGIPFDLVIMDLTIPGGLGGKETIKSLLEIDPKINAIVSSGYSNDPVMANYKAYGFSGVIVKPFTLSDIKKILHSTITIEQ